MVIYSVNNIFSLEYHQFDSIAGTLTMMQTLPLSGSVPSYYLTLNGNYYAYATSVSGSFYLYQRTTLTGLFTLVY